ncbi:hydrolase [Nocardia concava]|uniref:hydrolase n=1 Tax=Nocardia concava TaxID=257281 RepID=UPI0002F9A59F|nr:hydrolase [Nocardia concava]
MTSKLLDPKSALVLIDLQRGITAAPTQPHAVEDVVARGAQLAKAFRDQGLPVVLVRVSWADDGGDMPPGRTMQAGGGNYTPPQGWDVLVDELDVQPGDIRITKRHWGAFHGTELDVQLRRRGVSTIVLGGIATSIGVESTARAAHEHGYHVVIAADATADRETDSHDHSMRKIFPRLGVTATTDEVLSALAELPTQA